MWRHSLYWKALVDQRWQIIGFGLALALIAALDVSIWPAYKDQLQLLELPPALEAFLGTDLAIGTPAGYLSAEFFSWIIVLLIVYAVLQGTGAIAGEESAGTMDLLLAQPVRRAGIVAAKTAATVTGTALIISIGYVGFAITMQFVSLDPQPPLAGETVSRWDALVACANMAPITLAFFGLSIWLGAVAPTRGHASAVAIGIATAAYVAEYVASIIDSLSGLRYASPFFYYGRGEPLIHGINWTRAAILLASSIAFVALAMRAFERRDVTTGGATDMGWQDLLRRATGVQEAELR